MPENVWHQFVGLFMGEGSVSIRENHLKEGFPTLYVSLAIALREDDRHVLDFLQEYLGGNLGIDNHGKNPQVRWVLQKTKDIEIVAIHLLETCILPAKKLQDLQVILDFISWRNSLPYRCGDYTPGWKFREKLMQSRSYGAIRG
jgi:hypothetical protein